MTHAFLQAVGFSCHAQQEEAGGGEGEVFCPAGLQLYNKIVHFHSKKNNIKEILQKVLAEHGQRSPALGWANRRC